MQIREWGSGIDVGMETLLKCRDGDLVKIWDCGPGADAGIKSQCQCKDGNLVQIQEKAPVQMQE